MMIRATVKVMLKDDVMDPQGTAVAQALASLGHTGVKRVRVGRAFDLTLEADNADTARAEVRGMCESLLANTVIERYDIEAVGEAAAAAGDRAGAPA